MSQRETWQEEDLSGLWACHKQGPRLLAAIFEALRLTPGGHSCPLRLLGDNPRRPLPEQRAPRTYFTENGMWPKLCMRRLR
jgi:hypothetical protein